MKQLFITKELDLIPLTEDRLYNTFYPNLIRKYPSISHEMNYYSQINNEEIKESIKIDW